jgi:intracellular multiplication protein IcmJ
MKLRELYLQINPSGLRMMKMRDRHDAFASTKTKILARDNITCQFCGFKGIEQQMNVVNLDGNYNNNSVQNLCIACSICSRAMLLGSFEAANEQDSVERLIICNELSQVQLNHLYRVLLTSMSDATLEQCEIAKTIFRSLRNRAVLVDEMFGKNASDTRVFAQSVFDSGVSSHNNLRVILQNLRYFPTRHSFYEEWPLWKKQLREQVSNDIKIRF